MIIVIVAVAEGGIEVANYVAEIAKLYRLKLNEVFRLSGCVGTYFKFVDEGLVRSNYDDIWLTESQDLVDILTGRRRVIKYSPKPKYGDTYYVASSANVMDMYEIFRWTDSAIDEKYFERGIVFSTADRAVEATKEMLDMLNGKMVEQQGINHMRDVVELLGVDFGESFQLNSATIKSDFKFTIDGLYMFSQMTEDWVLNSDVLYELITGTYTINKPKKPLAMGTEYFIPNLTYPSLYAPVTWSAKDFDTQNLKNGLICKTKEEAIELAKKMLVLAKEKYKNV